MPFRLWPASSVMVVGIFSPNKSESVPELGVKARAGAPTNHTAACGDKSAILLRQSGVHQSCDSTKCRLRSRGEKAVSPSPDLRERKSIAAPKKRPKKPDRLALYYVVLARLGITRPWSRSQNGGGGDQQCTYGHFVFYWLWSFAVWSFWRQPIRESRSDDDFPFRRSEQLFGRPRVHD